MPGNSDELKWGLMAQGRPLTPSEGHAQSYARVGPAGTQKLRTFANGTCLSFGPLDPVLDYNPNEPAFFNQLALVDTAIRNIRAENQGRYAVNARPNPNENHSDATSERTAVDEDAFANFRTETLDPTHRPRVTLESGTYIQLPSKYISVIKSVSIHSVSNKSDVAGEKHPGAADTRFGVYYSGYPKVPNDHGHPAREKKASPVPSHNGLPADVPRGPRNPHLSGRRHPAENVHNPSGHSASSHPPRRRAGRGRDGKLADSEYAKYLDELNIESAQKGESILRGDRWSGEAAAIARFGVGGFGRERDAGDEFGIEVQPPTPETRSVAPSPAPSAAATTVSSSLVGRHSAPASVSPFAAPAGGVYLTTPGSLADMTGTIFGQAPGTVTPRDQSLSRRRRLFEL